MRQKEKETSYKLLFNREISDVIYLACKNLQGNKFLLVLVTLSYFPHIYANNGEDLKYL